MPHTGHWPEPVGALRAEKNSHSLSMPMLFDDLVGPAGQCQRYREPERLGSLEVDDQFDLHHLLDREIGRRADELWNRSRR